MPDHRMRVGVAVLACGALAILASCVSEGGRGESAGGPPSFGPGGQGGMTGFGPGGGPGSGPGAPPRGRSGASARAPVQAMPAQTQSLAVDGSGAIYVTDSSGNRVLRIDVSGALTTTAGTGRKGYAGDGGPAVSAELSNNGGDSGPALVAQLSSPTGLAVARSGDLYIFDSDNRRIRRVTADGIITACRGEVRLNMPGP